MLTQTEDEGFKSHLYIHVPISLGELINNRIVGMNSIVHKRDSD